MLMLVKFFLEKTPIVVFSENMYLMFVFIVVLMVLLVWLCGFCVLYVCFDYLV